MPSGVSLDTIEDKQKLCDFIEVKRGGLCGIMGDRYVDSKSKSNNKNNNERNVWYKLYAYPMLQKLPYNRVKYSTTSQDIILNIPYDSDKGYWIVCDVDYNDIWKDKTEQLTLMLFKKDKGWWVRL